MTSIDRSRAILGWAVTVVMLLAVSVATLFDPVASRRWVEPDVMFSLVSVGAAACMVAATIVMAIADRRDTAEIGLLGAAMLTASVLLLVRGLTTPGVLFDSSDAFASASFLTMPVAVAVASPLLLPGSRVGRWAARHWREWTMGALVGTFGLAVAAVLRPEVVDVPAADGWVTIALSVLLVIALVSLSYRQMRLYDIGRRPANLIASISIVLLAMLSLTPLTDDAFTVGSWWLQAAGGIGVIGACAALAVTHRMSRTANSVLSPVLSRDPLVAFELGLSPTVRSFVAEIDLQDEPTRDHVVRICELSMRVGERFGLSMPELRRLGLAAMLHDVGKVKVPVEILEKPGRLTDDEYEVMKRHTVEGEAMLAADPTLAPVARIVRSHHERFDGAGYPDGLAGEEIPLASRIIAVCDAFDAMTNERQYRAAMPMDLVFAILREHSGSQWDARVVDEVLVAVATMPMIDAFAGVGRADSAVAADMTPDDVGDLLVAVDAEI